MTPRARYDASREPLAELRARALVLLRFGNTEKQIAKELGISIARVNRWRASAGMQRHRTSTRHEKQMARELRFERGWTITAIAKKLGFHRSCVSRWLERSGRQ